MWGRVNLTLNPTLWGRVNLTLNPTLWGIFRKTFRILHCEEFWNEKNANDNFLQACDDTLEIFDIDANDDSVQAWRKFLTMLDFYLDESNIVRNFSKYFQILHCEEFWNEKWNSSHCGIFTWKNFFTPPPTFFNCWSWCQKKFHRCEEFYNRI